MASPSALPGFLNAWVPRQRWFTSKGRSPVLHRLGSWSLDTPEADVEIQVPLILDTSGGEPVLYQIPVTTRRAPLAGGSSALISQDAAGYHYDGPHDPAFTGALLQLVLSGGRAAGDRCEARGRALGQPRDWRMASSRVMTGEQSNTSIVFDLADATGSTRPAICKIFRVLQPGDNPDVAVQCALAAAGSRHVPEPLGYLSGLWPTAGTDTTTGHLAFVQEFLPDAPDAWRVAQQAAAAGEDFRQRAHDLGETTAAIHADLAGAFPTESATPAAIAAIVQSMRERFHAAARDVPVLAGFDGAVGRVFDSAAGLAWPPLQRIHGDYHLGQVLEMPGRGWMLIDFEGEPLRPIHERSLPDVPLRDVAGMLRSLSYVAGSIAAPGGDDAAAGWARAAREAFLDGYTARSGRDLRAHHELLDVFELDKAIYEVRYEARNRPDWLPIPLAAVRRLVEVSAGKPSNLGST